MPAILYPIEEIRGDRFLPGASAVSLNYIFQSPVQQAGVGNGSRAIYVHGMFGGICVGCPAYATLPGRLLGLTMAIQCVGNTNNGTTQIHVPLSDGGRDTPFGATATAGAISVPIMLNFGFPGLPITRSDGNVFSINIDTVHYVGTGAATGVWEFNPSGIVKVNNASWGNVQSGIALSYSYGMR